MSARDTLDSMLLQEIRACCDRVEKLSKITHFHSGVLKVQNIILTAITLAVLGLSFGIITDWVKEKYSDRTTNQPKVITRTIERG